MSWHATHDQLMHWEQGRLPPPAALSIDSHLQACEQCRHTVGAAAHPAVIDARWEALADRLDGAPTGLTERLLGRLGVSSGTARLLAATPSLQLPWFLAILVSVAFAGLVAGTPVSGDLWLFVATAPIVPVVGIALAYGPGSDPTFEMGQTAPMHGLRLLLIRATAVLVSSIVVTTVGALALPMFSVGIAIWLLPALTLSVVTIALEGWLRPIVAGSATAIGWLAVIATLARLRLDVTLIASGAFQFVLLIVTIVGVAAVIGRRDAFDIARRG